MSESPALPIPGMSWSIRIRLSLMMFLQFMMFAVFFVALAVYLKNIGVTGKWRALALSSQALGCLASPIIGMIADRHFASQKVLAVLNLLSVALLVVVSQVTDPTIVVIALIAQQLCYMPTWGLTSSIAMSHSPSEKFPQIRVFGSIGWVAAGLFSIVAGWLFVDKLGVPLKIDGTSIPFLCGAGTGLVAAFVALTLPNTPPPAKGQKASIVDALGLRSFSLMKNPSFAIFIIISTLVMIPFAIYWSFCSVFLQSKGFEYITVTMNLGQLVEMFAMLLVPLGLAKLGVKWTMVLGLLALVVRYLLFLGGDSFDTNWMYFGAILVHGVIFGFFFVGGQVYVDKKAPKELRAQAQGLLFLITFGVGLLAGNFFNEWLIGANSWTTTPVAKTALVGTVNTDTTLTTDANTSVPVAITDVRLHDRALNGAEVGLLTASEKLRTNLLAEAEKKGIAADEKKGQIYSGDILGVQGKPVGNALSFSMDVTFPAKKEKEMTFMEKLLGFFGATPPEDKADVFAGTLFQTGTDANSICLSLEKNVFVLQSGETKIAAKTVKLNRKPGDDGKVQPMHITVTYDEKGLTLYTNTAAYRTYDWRPIWMLTVAISAALLVLFVLAFHYKEDKAPKAVA